MMRFGGFLGSIGLAAALAVSPSSQMVLPAVPTRQERRISKRKLRKLIAEAMLGRPMLNRARRHPSAQTYAHAAQISTALGRRTAPLR